MAKQIPTLYRQDDEEYPFVDSNGCSWESPEQFVMVGILGACGCGDSDEYGMLAIEVLRQIPLTYEEKKANGFYEDKTKGLMLFFLDEAGLIEHGSSVNGSWLTENGKQLLTNIDSLIETL